MDGGACFVPPLVWPRNGSISVWVPSRSVCSTRNSILRTIAPVTNGRGGDRPITTVSTGCMPSHISSVSAPPPPPPPLISGPLLLFLSLPVLFTLPLWPKPAAQRVQCQCDNLAQAERARATLAVTQGGSWAAFQHIGCSPDDYWGPLLLSQEVLGPVLDCEIQNRRIFRGAFHSLYTTGFVQIMMTIQS